MERLAEHWLSFPPYLGPDPDEYPSIAESWYELQVSWLGQKTGEIEGLSQEANSLVQDAPESLKDPTQARSAFLTGLADRFQKVAGLYTSCPSTRNDRTRAYLMPLSLVDPERAHTLSNSYQEISALSELLRQTATGPWATPQNQLDLLKTLAEDWRTNLKGLRTEQENCRVELGKIKLRDTQVCIVILDP